MSRKTVLLLKNLIVKLTAHTVILTEALHSCFVIINNILECHKSNKNKIQLH